MQLGKNKLEAGAKGSGTGKLEIQNHPITGPVFAGPPQQPFFCQTHQFPLGYPMAPNLTATQIADPCHVDTRVDYVYRSTAADFKALPAGPLPGDLVMTTTTEGRVVPYIVRLETGTINRAIYQTAVLDNPAILGPDLQNHGDPGWNGRLVYTFGGGCPGGWYRQGNSTGGVLDNTMLSLGFAVASASLNVFGNNCNDLLAAETMMMVKERFIETYGPPRYTIGWGCSGGSYQVHQIGDNYPGLLDGIMPQCSFPDVNFGPTHTLADSAAAPQLLPEAGGGLPSPGRVTRGGRIRRVQPHPEPGRLGRRIDPLPSRPDHVSAVFNAIVPSRCAMTRSAIRPGHVHDLRSCGQCLRTRPGHGLRAATARQRGHRVWARGAQRRPDLEGAVPRSEREDRRLRPDANFIPERTVADKFVDQGDL